ncbi:hypothetical protein LCGC14_2965470 [marine sediment metagenome]|uniref:Zinc/iron-chelating domain-containing protein n=1 Tax=marine sediment metagenome TaxID=412755 RepID=A0A0F8XAX1_9ZZZZ
MSCERCGACCRNAILEIQHLDVVREPRLLEHAKLLDADLGHESDWDKEYFLPTPCPFLVVCIGSIVHDTCSIYPTRPNMCVAFDPDDEGGEDEESGSSNKSKHEMYRSMDKARESK